MRVLRGKNAVLTGASGGIGRYIGRALAREGINLALVARSPEGLDAAAAELEPFGVRVVPVPADIADRSARENLVAEAERALGQVDILVNNAGILHVAAVADEDPERVVAAIATNLTGPILLARMVLPGMLTRGSGHIVNIGSMAGKKGIPYEATYSATKTGLVQWTAALRMELEGTGVGVSTVLPTYVSEAGMAAGFWQRIPRMAGIVSPEDVAGAVLKALRKNPPEVIVMRGLARPMLMLDALSPGLGNAILKRIGVVGFQRAVADELRQDAETGTS